MKKIVLLLVVVFSVSVASVEAQKVIGMKVADHGVEFDLLTQDTIWYNESIPLTNLTLTFVELSIVNDNDTLPLQIGDTLFLELGYGGGAPVEYRLAENFGIRDTIKILDLGSQNGSGFSIKSDSIATNRIFASVKGNNVIGMYKESVLQPDFSKTVVFAKRKTPSAISEASLAAIKFYPNPVSGTLHIDNLKDANVSLYSLIGQKVAHYEQANGQLLVDVTSLAEGIYMLKINSGNQVRTEKVKVVAKQ